MTSLKPENTEFFECVGKEGNVVAGNMASMPQLFTRVSNASGAKLRVERSRFRSDKKRRLPSFRMLLGAS